MEVQLARIDGSSGRTFSWAGLGCALAVGLGVGLALGRGGAHAQPVKSISPPVAEGGQQRTLLVDVAGGVRRPGVYELPEGARVRDAVARAGGPAEGSDLATVNRAAPLVDGQQVLVPSATPAAAPAAGTSGGTGAGTGSAPSAGRVSLNSSDAAALDGLPGIGPVTAQKIIEDRTANGPFRSAEDLDRVSGIGPATLEQLRDLVGP